MIKKIFALLALSFVLSFFACQNPENKNSDTKEAPELTIFHAGSLSLPFKQLVQAFKLEHPEIVIKLEGAGSVACARKIIDLDRECDIMASADYKVIDDLLIPDYASWNIKFAGNELVLAYHKKSNYKDIINGENWYDILQKTDVKYGRSSPNSDPCGYRTVLALKLAEKYYNIPGMADQITSKDQNYIRPKEVDLVALMETNSIDYAFNYRSVAQQHHFSFLSLPDQINLKDPEKNDLYNDVSVPIQGKKPGDTLTIFGESMVYGITILNNSTQKEAAIAFVDFLLNPEKGMKIIEQNGQHGLVPQVCREYEKIPAGLKGYALRE